MIRKLLFRICEKFKQEYVKQLVLGLVKKHSTDEFINILNGKVSSENMGEFFFQIGSLLYDSSYHNHALSSLEYASIIYKNENNITRESAVI